MTHTSMRRWTVLVLVSVATFVASLPAHALPDAADGQGPFVDTDGTAHEDAVAALWFAGITAGCAEWRYCPEEPVTRAEMAAFLARALSLPRAEVEPFVDVMGSAFAGDIEAIAAASITYGCDDDRYCPHLAVSREQMASFLARALELPVGDGDSFVDGLRSIHAEDIERLAAAGITRGCDVDRYCPGRPVTRAEMATFLLRALDLPVPDELPVIPPEVIEAYLAERAEPTWPTGPGAEGWRPLIELFFEPGDVDRAIRIVACESNGDPNARNRSSGASGLFQHMPFYWAERASGAGYPGASIFDPEANVAAAAWLVYEYGNGGWHHWVCKG